MTIEQKLRDEYRIGYFDGFAEGYEESVKEAVIAVKDLLEPAVIAKCYRLPLEKIIDIINQESCKEAGTAQ